MRITTELNNSYHTPTEIRDLFSKLTGREVDETFGMFPPFYTDCGKNIRVGKHVFINSGCHFQDQGGITIGDGSLIGHNVMLATLNHGLEAEERHDLFPAPIHIGRNVWIGANATVLPGVTIGDHAVIAAAGAILALSGVGSITLGTLVSFLTLNRNATQPISQISQQLNSIVMAMAGARRIFALLDEKPEEDNGYVLLVNTKENAVKEQVYGHGNISIRQMAQQHIQNLPGISRSMMWTLAIVRTSLYCITSNCLQHPVKRLPL